MIIVKRRFQQIKIKGIENLFYGQGGGNGVGEAGQNKLLFQSEMILGFLSTSDIHHLPYWHMPLQVGGNELDMELKLGKWVVKFDIELYSFRQGFMLFSIRIEDFGYWSIQTEMSTYIFSTNPLMMFIKVVTHHGYSIFNVR